jgi:hypothetical protein
MAISGVFTENIEKSLVIDLQRFFVKVDSGHLSQIVYTADGSKKVGEAQYDARITSVRIFPRLSCQKRSSYRM